MWRIKVPKPLQAMLDGRANFYHSLGYDKAKAFALAIKYQEKYIKLFRSIRSSLQNSSLQSGSQLLSDLGIPLRQHTQELLTFSEALKKSSCLMSILDMFVRERRLIQIDLSSNSLK
jgi:hypothetical protein